MKFDNKRPPMLAGGSEGRKERVRMETEGLCERKTVQRSVVVYVLWAHVRLSGFFVSFFASTDLTGSDTCF